MFNKAQKGLYETLPARSPTSDLTFLSPNPFVVLTSALRVFPLLLAQLPRPELSKTEKRKMLVSIDEMVKTLVVLQWLGFRMLGLRGGEPVGKWASRSKADLWRRATTCRCLSMR